MLLTQATRPAVGFVADVIALTKPRLSSLVVATTAVGLVVAPGHVSAARGVLVVFFTAVLVGAANVLNSYLERDVDARMLRTANRPLPSGRLDPRVALSLGIAGGVITVPLLALVANTLTAALGALAYVSYVAWYTPLKRKSSWAVVVGCLPGAIPPAMGVTAVTGRFDPIAAALFAILFLWQLPHFISISVYLKDEYTRGGLKVFSVVHGNRAAAITVAGSALALVPASLAPVAMGLAGTGYGIVAAASSLGFVALSAAGPFARDYDQWARRVFRATLGYLVVLLAALSVSAG